MPIYGKPVGANGVKPNWNQNDASQSDYVKNRTHYRVEEHIDEKQYDLPSADNLLPLVLGEEWYAKGRYSGTPDRYLPRDDKLLLPVVTNSSGDLCICSDGYTDFATGSEKNNCFVVYADHIYQNASWKNGYGAAVTVLYRAAYSKIQYKTLDENYIPTTVPRTLSASAGDILRVKSVDEDGKPTEWEAIDISPETLIVNLTEGSDGITADKTFSEIKEAFYSGKIVMAKFMEAASVPLIGIDGSIANFQVMMDNMVVGLQCKSQGGSDTWGINFIDMATAADARSLGITGASAGQIIKVKSVDASGKPTKWESADIPQSDWGQTDPDAPDYVKNKTHYITPTTPIGTLSFTATASNTMTHTISHDDYDIFQYFQQLSSAGEVIKVTISDINGLLSTTFDRGTFSFSGIFAGNVNWNNGQVLTATIQNNAVTLMSGTTYDVAFEDITTPTYKTLDVNFLPPEAYTSLNAPVKFGEGFGSTVQGEKTLATGVSAHAEGYVTKASGHYSHAQGVNSVASGRYSFAGGEGTVANREGMNALGRYNMYDHLGNYIESVTVASHSISGKQYWASEYTFNTNTGLYTLVDPIYTDVVTIGSYYSSSESSDLTYVYKVISLITDNTYQVECHNIKEVSNSRGPYVCVIGNGLNGGQRSNAHTLDWDGNAWFAGDVYTGGTGQDDSTAERVVTESDIAKSLPLGITGATAGQIIKIKSVDDNGIPTEWEAVDIPSSTGIPLVDRTTGVIYRLYIDDGKLSMEESEE